MEFNPMKRNLHEEYIQDQRRVSLEELVKLLAEIGVLQGGQNINRERKLNTSIFFMFRRQLGVIKINDQNPINHPASSAQTSVTRGGTPS